MKKPPLSDAERQRRRRQKLKAKDEERKYNPKTFIAEAICNLYGSGELSSELFEKIRTEATRNAKETYPEMSVVMQKYVEKRITDFLSSNETET